jgi:hypothetical protein
VTLERNPLAYLRTEAKRIGLPSDRIHCLLTIDAFPSDEAPQIVKTADLWPGESWITTTHKEPLDEFSDPEGKWSGYRYEALGCLKADHPLSHRRRAAAMEALVFNSFMVEDVELWLRRVRPPGTTLYAEVQWRPGYTEPEPFIGGWPARRTKDAEITRARKALGLIGEISGHGGRSAVSAATVRNRLLLLADQAESNGDPIDVYALSKYAIKSPRAISYWLERAGWGIEDLRIRLRRRKQRQSRRV